MSVPTMEYPMMEQIQSRNSGRVQRVESWMAALGENGYRQTGTRRAVVEIVIDSDRILSAEEVFTQAQSAHPTIGRATVYRTLERLEALDLIQRVHQVNSCHSYCATTSGSESLLVCRICGRIAVLAQEVLDLLAASVTQTSGYTLRPLGLQLIGICAECGVK